MAKNLATGGDVSENLGYFGNYPHLRGVVLIMALIYRLFPTNALMVIYGLNTAFIILAIYFIARIVYFVSDSLETAFLTVIMLDTFMPLAFYTLFVYGTVPSIFMVTLGFYFTFKFCDSESTLSLVGMCISFAASVFLYSGAMIAILAAVIYLLFVGQNRDILRTAIAVIILLLELLLVGKIASLMFAVCVGKTVGSGIPMSLYLYLGLASDAGLCGPGSFDQYYVDYYHELSESGVDTSAVLAGDVVRTVREYFSGDRSFIYFYEKWKCQWTNSMFDSTRVTQTTNVELYGIGKEYIDFLRGPFFTHIHDYLDVYQYLVYVLAFLACVRSFAVGKGRQIILPGMFFVGGFMFQTLFESAARYCMIYFLVLIAFASCEIVNIRKAIEKYGKKRNHVRVSSEG